jgi:hypothetical protein
MYIIEFKKSWVKKEGKLSLCKVLKDEYADTEVVSILNQYIKDVKELVEIKLGKIQEKYNVNPSEIRRIKELLQELDSAYRMHTKE